MAGKIICISDGHVLLNESSPIVVIAALPSTEATSEGLGPRHEPSEQIFIGIF